MIVRLPNPMAAAVWLSFFAAPALLGGRADGALCAAVVVLGAAILYSQPSPWEARAPSAQALKIFLLLEFLYLVSALYSAGVNGNSPSSYFELLRYALLGVFAVYLIRHFDASARRALEWAAVGTAYLFFLHPAADPQGYVAVLTLCWLLFFSRLRLRFLHAATALLVVVFSGFHAAWAAAFIVLAAAASVLVFRRLVRARARHAARLALLFAGALLAVATIYLRATGAAAPAPLSSTEAVALQFIRRSPIFGWGAVDGASILGDNQYLFWMIKEGALGSALILVGLALAAYRLLRTAKGDAARLGGSAAFLAGIAWMLTAGRFLESYRLCFVTAFFMAGMCEMNR